MTHRTFDYEKDLSQPLLAFLKETDFPFQAVAQHSYIFPEGMSYHPSLNPLYDQ